MATKRTYNMGTRATEFSKLIQSMTGKHQLWEIWADFVTMAACCISNSVDSGNRERREDLWEHFFRDCLLPWHEISENDMDGGDNIMNTNPECFTPEGNNPYPLCTGKDMPECENCQLRAGWNGGDTDEDEG